jgi:response regulator RpfG family c-di-GMP phosphodiesterase
MEKPTILLIEDDEASLELYRRELSSDFTVLVSTNDDDVLRTITTRQVQAVIIEPESPSGLGWELIEQIATLDCEHIPAVIICSVQDQHHKNLNSTVAAYLIKPVLPKDLSKKIKGVLGIQKTVPKTNR